MMYQNKIDNKSKAATDEPSQHQPSGKSFAPPAFKLESSQEKQDETKTMRYSDMSCDPQADQTAPNSVSRSLGEDFVGITSPDYGLYSNVTRVGVDRYALTFTCNPAVINATEVMVEPMQGTQILEQRREGNILHLEVHMRPETTAGWRLFQNFHSPAFQNDPGRCGRIFFSSVFRP